MMCGADPAGLTLPLMQASAEVRAVERHLNWGAGFLPGFWSYKHGAPVLGTFFWIMLLPLPPISMGIMLYLLTNGNRIALQHRRYRDVAEFHKVEHAWSVWGWVTIPISFILFMSYLVALVSATTRAGVQ
ncbi:MAG TPA: hypothetical protein VHT05_12745 [Candidatus Elarobacter sp.]|nr:hypothetical protein [Candidatus Elarobacter sp.]